MANAKNKDIRSKVYFLMVLMLVFTAAFFYAFIMLKHNIAILCVMPYYVEDSAIMLFSVVIIAKIVHLIWKIES